MPSPYFLTLASWLTLVSTYNGGVERSASGGGITNAYFGVKSLHDLFGVMV